MLALISQPWQPSGLVPLHQAFWKHQLVEEMRSRKKNQINKLFVWEAGWDYKICKIHNTSSLHITKSVVRCKLWLLSTSTQPNFFIEPWFQHNRKSNAVSKQKWNSWKIIQIKLKNYMNQEQHKITEAKSYHYHTNQLCSLQPTPLFFK